jgi:hypothetical protein
MGESFDRSSQKSDKDQLVHTSKGTQTFALVATLPENVTIIRTQCIQLLTFAIGHNEAFSFPVQLANFNLASPRDDIIVVVHYLLTTA